MARVTVTVFGGSAARDGTAPYRTAFELGQQIARAGWTLCNGGYGGTMEAAARGAVEAGGHTIGVTCLAFSRPAGPNRYIRQEVPAPDLLQRLNTLLRLGDAYVVLPGSSGTLLELAAALELTSKRLLRPPRPLLLLGDFWQPVVERIAQPRQVAGAVHMVRSVADARGRLSSHFSGNASSR